MFQILVHVLKNFRGIADEDECEGKEKIRKLFEERGRKRGLVCVSVWIVLMVDTAHRLRSTNAENIEYYQCQEELNNELLLRFKELERVIGET